MGSIFQNESFFHMWASFPYVVHFSHIRVFFREWGSNLTHPCPLKRSVFVCGSFYPYVSRFTHMWVSFRICGALFTCKGLLSRLKVWFTTCMFSEEVSFCVWVSFPICGSLFPFVGLFSYVRFAFHKRMSIFTYVCHLKRSLFLSFFNGFLFLSMGLIHVQTHDRHRFPFYLFPFLFFFWTEFRFRTTHHEPPRFGCAQKSHKPANFVFVSVTILLFDRIQIWLGTSRTLASDSRTQMTAALWFSLWKPLKRCLFPHELAHFFHTSPRFVTPLKCMVSHCKENSHGREREGS